MSKLTVKINDEWDFNGLEGELVSGIVCQDCGEIVRFAYEQMGYSQRHGFAIYCYCEKCVRGEIKPALTCHVG